MSVADVLGNIFMACSASVAILTLIDWALTKTQKDYLTDKAISFWVWLDDQSPLDYLKSFKDYKTQARTSLIIQLFIAGGMALSLTFSILAGQLLSGQPLVDQFVKHFSWVVVGALAASVVMSLLIHPLILSWITQGESSLVYFLKSTVSVSPFLLIVEIFPNWVREGFNFGASLNFPTFPDWHPIQSFGFGFLAASSSVLLFFWYINIVLMAVWIMSYIVFYTIRFVLLRVIDNPKGIVLGLSGLVGAVGAVIKAFLGK
jgi:hypothetical protein